MDIYFILFSNFSIMTKYLIIFLLKSITFNFKKSTKTQTGGSLTKLEVSLLSPLLGSLTSIFHD